ncbi:transposase [Streptomyces parvulus]|uniref:transposase n=1 Tax=Streptomyces parvulus TaxID=146923 RepID=UPI0033D9F678
MSHVSHPDTAVGIDLGVKHLAVLADSSGQTRYEPNPEHLDGALKLLRFHSRRVSQRQGPDRRTGRKPSRRWEKANRESNKVHHRVANLRAGSVANSSTRGAATSAPRSLPTAGARPRRPARTAAR